MMFLLRIVGVTVKLLLEFRFEPRHTLLGALMATGYPHCTDFLHQNPPDALLF